MDRPMFSIVVPVYNVEKYLHKCVKSILSQCYENFEVILVDDGSTDRCSEICDEFALNDSRCRVIHQPNKGLSGARNSGLKEANGIYILFIDSDDEIAPNLLNCLEINFNKYNVDIIGFNAVVNDIKGQCILSTGKNVGMVEDGIKIVQKRIPVSTVPLYCYKNKFLRKTNIIFKDGIYYEDVLFTAQIFMMNPKVFFLDETLYYYNKREESITTSKIKMKNYCDIVSICCELLDYKVVDDIVFKNAYRNIIMSYIMLSEEIYRGMSMEDRKKGKINRQILMNNVKQRKSRVGTLNYFVAEFPSLFYLVREIRRKIR